MLAREGLSKALAVQEEQEALWAEGEKRLAALHEVRSSHVGDVQNPGPMSLGVAPQIDSEAFALVLPSRRIAWPTWANTHIGQNPVG